MSKRQTGKWREREREEGWGGREVGRVKECIYVVFYHGVHMPC